MSRPVFLIAGTFLLLIAGPAAAMGNADPLLAMLRVDKLEVAVDEDPTPQRFEAKGWLGYDLNKLWLKSEVEREGSETESADLELLYGRAISPYWDAQVGWKRDFEPGPKQDWLAIALHGLAPYFFEVDSSLYLADGGRSSLSFMAEYELLFTQKWILSPELEFDLNGYNDEVTGAGSGLSKLELGLRLRYEIRREFAPYIGLHWERLYGNTADFARADGHDTDSLQFVVGLRAWF